MNHVMRHLGIPSGSVPMGTMKDTGMPVGLTFAGPSYSDVELLRWVFDYETASRKRRPPKSVPELGGRQTPRPDEGVDGRHSDTTESRRAAPKVAIELSGTGQVSVSGAIILKIKAAISTVWQGGTDGQTEECSQVPPAFSVSLALVADGVRRFTLEMEGAGGSECFGTSVEIPTSERRGARLQSSLVVAVASVCHRGGRGVGEVGRITSGGPEAILRSRTAVRKLDSRLTYRIYSTVHLARDRSVDIELASSRGSLSITALYRPARGTCMGAIPVTTGTLLRTYH
ncbi:hypothetical protein GGR56DRAFT_643551 [Xylariaceae sp. FL0804]|nr:hypothetical protein GGR56DRAFT_643551 [Xylariaceae sp. FL0804]